MKTLIVSLLAMFLLGPSARAEEPPRLSDGGRTMVGGPLGGSWWMRPEPIHSPGRGIPRWEAWLRPSIVHFVRDRVGLGLYGGYGATRGRFEPFTDYWDQAVSLGATAAIEAVVSGRFGLFLLPYFGYARRWREAEHDFQAWAGSATEPYESRQTDNRLQFGLSIPLVFHVSESVAIGFGPNLLIELIYLDQKGVPAYDFGLGPPLPTTMSRDFVGLRMGAESWIAYSF